MQVFLLILLLFIPGPLLAESASSDVLLPAAFIGYTTRCLDHPGGHSTLEVLSVVPDSPAELTGIRVGDHVVAFNDVPFKFKTDSQVIRSMGWLKPDVPFEISVLRGGERKILTVVPRSVPADYQKQFMIWLENFEASNDRACSEKERQLEIEWRIIQERVREAGGKASIVVERLEGEPPSFKVTSTTLNLPQSFDWRAHWPSYDHLAKRLTPGQTFVVQIEASNETTRIDVHSDDLKIRDAD